MNLQLNFNYLRIGGQHVGDQTRHYPGKRSYLNGGPGNCLALRASGCTYGRRDGELGMGERLGSLVL